MSREKVLSRARQVGLESMAEQMLDEGYGEAYIEDVLLREVARNRSGSGKSISQISDDELVRGLCEPGILGF